MSIIDSIYEETGAFTMHIKDTNNILLIRNGEVDSVAIIIDVPEMYNENIDCKILNHNMNNILSASSALGLSGLLFFEYLDKHVFIPIGKAKTIIKGSEYTFIPKERVIEIKGGLYKIDYELVSNLS